MAMPKKTGIIFVTIGVVLMLSALLLFVLNRKEDQKAGQEAELLLGKLRSAIETKVEKIEAGTAVNIPVSGNVADTVEINVIEELPIIEIDGYGYIGYISMIDLDLELPVMAEWDYDRLKLAPCRHFGSTKTNDLVIAAHNYSSHFGDISELKAGSQVSFTDMNGEISWYALDVLKTVEPEDVDAVLNSGYDLVLYTCTPGGATRVAAFFNRCTSVASGENADE